jgi:alpha-tubulin suppressor-like RCC1 family protein
MKVILIILIYILIILIITKIYFNQIDYFTTKYGYECKDCELCDDDQYYTGSCGGLINNKQCHDCDDCGEDLYKIGCYGTEVGTCVANWGVSSCGNNEYGQLGFDSNGKDENTDGLRFDYRKKPYHILPVLIENNIFDNIKIIKISCDNHSLFLTREGHVYSSGYNKYGQLGLGDTTNIITPRLIETYYNSNLEEINYDRITISEISAGLNHSLFLTSLTSGGNVYSCGYNVDGHLGIGTSGSGEDKSTPTLIRSYYDTTLDITHNYDEITITKISASCTHSLFLTNNKHVYSCGNNNKGQLGLGSTDSQNIPQLIETFGDTLYNEIQIDKISSKCHFSLFLTSEGHVYSCGWHNRGQLGLGEDTEEKVKTPTLIQRYYDDAVQINYDSITITEISSGYYHSLFLTSQGYVYSCGWNTKGENGFEVESAQKVWVPKLIKTFEDTAYDEIQIKKISAGAFFSLFLTQTGSVYSCGSNAYGKLCLNSNDDKKTTPKLIEKSNNVRITEISSGVDHSLFLLSYGNFDIVEEEEEVEREELEEEQEEAPSVPEPESETILPPPKKKIAKKKK